MYFTNSTYLTIYFMINRLPSYYPLHILTQDSSIPLTFLIDLFMNFLISFYSVVNCVCWHGSGNIEKLIYGKFC